MNSMIPACLLVFGILMMTSLSAQDVAAHRWQDRVVLLLTDDLQSPDIKEQLAVFRESPDGMRERKLVIYSISPAAWNKGLSPAVETRSTVPSKIYQRFHSGAKPFQLILIGLDGGVKWRVNEVVSCEDLFALIDGMPMRRAEMRRKSGG